MMSDNQLSVVERTELEEQEKIIEAGLKTFVEVGNALMKIRDERLYRDGFQTFESYCQDRWNLSKTHVNRTIAAAEVVGNLTPMGVSPENERQARPLTQLPLSQQSIAWQEAVETAPDGKVTAGHVESTVKSFLEQSNQVETEILDEPDLDGPIPFEEKVNGKVESEPSTIQIELDLTTQPQSQSNIRTVPKVEFYTVEQWSNLSEPIRKVLLSRESDKKFNLTNENVEWASWTWNPVTGCLHNCSYCLEGSTLIWMADDSTKQIKDIKIGDKIIGFSPDHEEIETTVTDCWLTNKEAYKITVSKEFDDIELVCSADHRWMTDDGWKYTYGHKDSLTLEDILLTYDYGAPDYCTILSIEPLNKTIPMYDISTGTEDFIANGVVSHNCYARDIAQRFYNHVDQVEDRFIPMFYPDRLTAPVNTKIPDLSRFDKLADRIGHKSVFVCSMADLWGKWVPGEWIEAVLEQARNSPQWNFIFLTKFPIRMSEFEFPQNTMVGTTVDSQFAVERAEKAFRKITAGIKWLSCEPMMERLTFTSLEMFDWVVCGGASKSTQTPEFRPPREWIEHLRWQAKNAGCTFYEKTNLGALTYYKTNDKGEFLKGTDGKKIEDHNYVVFERERSYPWDDKEFEAWK